MNQDEARSAIIAEWHLWANKTNTKDANGDEGFNFFNFLQNERDHLLNFHASGDKWQIIHSWLLAANLVSN